MPIRCTEFQPLAERPRAALPADLVVIGLVGRAGAGKDTVADYLCDHWGFERYSFAAPIKTMAEALFVELGIDYAYLFERSMKEAPIPPLGGLSARQLMQTLGTEWARDQLHPDFWLHCATMALGLDGGQPCAGRIVITDVRFPNEAAWVRHWGGLLTRVERPGIASVAAHTSETHADLMPVDYVLHNGATVPDLHTAIEYWMTAEVCP